MASLSLNNLPLVSVVIPCYNHEKYVEEAIESVANQSYKNIELIVIDDGSKDGSVRVLEELQNKYSFSLIVRENRGLSKTLNEGIRESRGAFISVLASDDAFLPNKIEDCMNEFSKLDATYAVVSGDALFMDEHSKLFNRKASGMVAESFDKSLQMDPRITDKEAGSYELFVYRNHIAAMAAVIRKDAWFDVGGFDEDYALEDWSFWLKVSRKYKIKKIQNKVAKYRLHEFNSVKRPEFNLRLKTDRFRIYLRERKYCLGTEVEDVWRDRFYLCVFDLLRKGYFRPLLINLPAKEYMPFFLFSLRRIKSRIFINHVAKDL